MPDELEADVLFDQPQQMSLRKMIFQPEVIEQSFGAVELPIMISRPPTMRIQPSMRRCFVHTMLLLNLILPIDVTFSIHQIYRQQSHCVSTSLTSRYSLPFAVGAMSSKDTDRSSTFVSSPVVKKK